MGRERSNLGAVLVVAGLWAVSSMAEADVNDLELTMPIALVDRSTAVAGAPAGFGYENGAELAAGLEGRLFFGQSDYFHMGVMVGGQHQAGPLFGLVDGHAFRTTVMEAGLTARVLFPCLSRGDVKWRLGGVLALSGMHADAGQGVGGQPNGPAEPERRIAADTLDHAGLGFRLGFDLSWHVQSFVIGLGLGARHYFGIDTPVARTWLLDLGLRVGARFDLFSPPAPVGLERAAYTADVLD
jgi:hypothetical protein